MRSSYAQEIENAEQVYTCLRCNEQCDYERRCEGCGELLCVTCDKSATVHIEANMQGHALLYTPVRTLVTGITHRICEKCWERWRSTLATNGISTRSFNEVP